jgi:N-acetylglucosamine malate deacetylase 1
VLIALVGVQDARLELRFIAERMRNRFSLADRLEGTAWNPKVMENPPGRRFLVLSPHPDDDAVGCGGTIIKLLEAGAEVRVVYLSMQEGDFSQDLRRNEIQGALDRLGVRDHRLREAAFPSSREAIGLITEELRSYRPDSVFVPSPFENHNEHLRTFESYLGAIDGLKERPDALLYEVWGALMPNLLIPVNGVMQRKEAAILEHGTQVRDIDYVRVVRGMNGYRAATSALEGYAEAYLHLPANDLLKYFLP